MYYDNEILFWQILALLFIILCGVLLWAYQAQAELYYDMGYKAAQNEILNRSIAGWL